MTKEELHSKHPQYRCKHTLEERGFNSLLHYIYECTKCRTVKFSTEKLSWNWTSKLKELGWHLSDSHILKRGKDTPSLSTGSSAVVETRNRLDVRQSWLHPKARQPAPSHVAAGSVVFLVRGSQSISSRKEINSGGRHQDHVIPASLHGIQDVSN